MAEQITPSNRDQTVVDTDRRRSLLSAWIMRQELGEQERQVVSMRLTTMVASIAEIATILLFAFFYSQVGGWQLLAAAGLAGATLVGTLVANRLTARDQIAAAGHLMLTIFVLAYGGGEWIMEGMTLPLLLTGIPTTLVLGRIILPGRWSIWLLASAGFIANIAAGTVWQPFERMDLIAEAPFHPYIPFAVIAAFVLLIALIQVGRTFRFGTIRARLLTNSILVTTLLATVMAVQSSLVNLSTGQEAALTQLDLTAQLLEEEINVWTGALQRGLDNVLPRGEAQQEVETLMRDDPGTAAYRQAYLSVKDRFRRSLIHSAVYEEVFLLDQRGTVVASTNDSSEGAFRQQYNFFEEGLRRPFLQPPFMDRALVFGGLSMVASQPVRSEQGELLGVLAGLASLDKLREITGGRPESALELNTYLVSSNHTLLAGTGAEEGRRTMVNSLGAERAIGLQLDGIDSYADYLGEPVIGAYRWILDLDAALIVEQPQSDAYSSAVTNLALSVGVGVLGATLAAFASRAITQGIAGPLGELAATAEQVAAGSLELEAKVQRQDEIGALASAFNSMTSQLRALIGSLEQRVDERTQDLADRSHYLEAAAEVSRVAASILDADELVDQVVELIRRRFELYYVGLFIVEPRGNWAHLRSGTGEAGKAMLGRQHKIKVGEGMIGWSIANAQARIALEAETDEVRKLTAELPETRSEAAIPLRSRGRVLGALSVQDSHTDAFDQDIVAVLQTMADQIATALTNAQLFEESQAALEAQRRAYAESSHEAWRGLSAERSTQGYRYIRGGAAYRPEAVTTVDDAWQAEMRQAAELSEVVSGQDGEGAVLAVPLKVRDQVVGVLNLKKSDQDARWSRYEMDTLEAIVRQLEVALESARLYQETQRRATYESVTTQISGELRQSLDVEAVLKTAALEVRRALSLPEVTLRMVPPAGNGSEKEAEHDV